MTFLSFLDVQIYLSESRKLKAKLYKKPTDCMTLLHFHSHHPLSCKKGTIYSQALRYNMIISEDHILQEELSNVTRILLARAYLLHLIIKSIKKALTHNSITCYPNKRYRQKPRFSHCNSFLRHCQTIHGEYT